MIRRLDRTHTTGHIQTHRRRTPIKLTHALLRLSRMACRRLTRTKVRALTLSDQRQTLTPLKCSDMLLLISTAPHALQGVQGESHTGGIPGPMFGPSVRRSLRAWATCLARW